MEVLIDESNALPK